MRVFADSILDVVDDLVSRNERIEFVWKNSRGWSPPEAAQLLEDARLDRQVELTRCLKIWCAECPPEEVEGRLILGWVNLRSLVEGSFKFFLSIYAKDYKAGHQKVNRTKHRETPDGLTLDPLIEYFDQIVWENDQRAQLKPFVRLAQARGNAIHSYQHRDMGTFDEFFAGIRMYSELLQMIEDQLPPEPEHDIWR